MDFGGSFQFGPFSLSVTKSLDKKEQSSDSSTIENDKFLLKCADELNGIVVRFIELNGYEVKSLKKNKVDLDQLFGFDDKYLGFKEVFMGVKEQVEKSYYASDYHIETKREITDGIFKLRKIIKTHGLRNHVPPARYSYLKVKNKMNFLSWGKTDVEKGLSVLFWLGVFLIPYIFSWFILRKGYSKEQKFIAFFWMIVVLIIVNNK